MIEVDNVDSEGDEKIRNERREVVKAILNVLSDLEKKLLNRDHEDIANLDLAKNVSQIRIPDYIVEDPNCNSLTQDNIKSNAVRVEE